MKAGGTTWLYESKAIALRYLSRAAACAPLSPITASWNGAPSPTSASKYPESARRHTLSRRRGMRDKALNDISCSKAIAPKSSLYHYFPQGKRAV